MRLQCTDTLSPLSRRLFSSLARGHLLGTTPLPRRPPRIHYSNPSPQWLQKRKLNAGVSEIGTHFDTHLFVTRLEAQGFSRDQAEVLVASLSDVISDSVTDMMKNVATKAEQEKTVYTYKVDFAALKGEIQMLEKNEYAMLKSENERLVGEVEKLKQKLREEITRTQAGVRLDISLFRGASRDEASAHELKIKETDARVQSDISDLRTEMERVKYSVLSSLIGTITGAGALILAYMRMFQH